MAVRRLASRALSANERAELNKAKEGSSNRAARRRIEANKAVASKARARSGGSRSKSAT